MEFPISVVFPRKRRGATGRPGKSVTERILVASQSHEVQIARAIAHYCRCHS